jgi:hypothetical protein
MMMPSRDSSFELVPAHLRIYLPVMIRVCAQLVKDNEKGVATSAPTRKMIAMIYVTVFSIGPRCRTNQPGNLKLNCALT